VKRIVQVVWLLILAAALPVRAEELVATLTLDGLSFISFGDNAALPIAGSTIRLHFGQPSPDGSVSFRVDPADVSIAPIALADGQTLQYAIAAPTSGVMRTSDGGRTLAFTAIVAATLSGGSNNGTYTYTIPFTTEHVSAPNLEHTESVEVTGMRVVNGAWYTQLVGATTNKENAFPEPGAAVYTVLSGQFDQMP
jgi:hypothetical protein